MKAIHEKKNQDYAGNNNPFENFERSAEVMKWFDNDIDKAFVCLITTKLARLATLLNNKERNPNNESIEDSYLDLSTYCALWSSYYSRFNKSNQISQTNKSGLHNYPYRCEQCHTQFYHMPNSVIGYPDKYFCSLLCAETWVGAYLMNRL